MTSPAQTADRFTYQGFDVDGITGEVTCRYASSQHEFTERFIFGPEGNWDDPATSAAIRILYLLAGISYYKTTAAPIIDLGHEVSTVDEREFLLNFYREGLGEFAYRNDLDLAGLDVIGPDGSVPSVSYSPDAGRPLIPFGGGIDSIVTVESMRRDHPDAALFVVHPPGQRFAAIENPAATTTLPMVRVSRVIDPKVLRSRELGFLNGHVPITAVITATALVAAVLSQRDAVVLSNEWSASIPTLEDKGRPVNHQWSKSESFETVFARLVEGSLGPRISVFSYLRCRSELWVAQQFAGLTEYHPVFRSCNRAFHQDPLQRLDHWCGECDKCCFIDLILAPFLGATHLNDVFDGQEPLNNPALRDRFDALLGLAPDAKPFECVGDVRECQAALLLTRDRADRHDNVMVQQLIAALSDVGGQDDVDVTLLLAPIVPHYIPDRYAPPDLLVRVTSASVGLWGMGVEGTASLQRLQAMGIQPVLVDDKVVSDTSQGLPILRMNDAGLNALLDCDVVIKSPGISRYRPEVDTLEQAGVPVCSGLGLWLEDVDRQRVVCITGTKGKSTTSSLVCHLLTGLGYPARVGGNIGQPPWALSHEEAPDYWIIETSSFQVPDLTVAPPVVAVTSLSPDHLDWHGSVERYYADKLSLCSKPGVETALAPADDQLLRQLLGDVPTMQWVGHELGGPWVDHLHLPGAHNARNAALARAVLLSLGIDEANDEAALANAAEGFSGLESRCHSIGHVGGVEFVDDGLSTNVLSVTAALEAFEGRPVALLVGGADRGIAYSELGQALLARQQSTLVVTMPDNGPRIGEAVRDVTGAAVEVIDAPDLETAVTSAFRWCNDNGVVLLSPGAPSFGHFADYRDRGRAFAEAAAACGRLLRYLS